MPIGPVSSAAIVCQPSLGASLRKAWFYVIGTVFGAVVIVALTACFPQDRLGFLSDLRYGAPRAASWSTLLRNFAAFAAALAGYTAAIIASGELGATGGASEDVFMLAVTRASEVCIGIVSAAVVLGWTDFGGARRRLAAEFAAISAEIARGLADEFSLPDGTVPETGPLRRDLVGRVIALDPVIDEAHRGVAPTCAFTRRYCRKPSGGLFAALSGWRMAAAQLEQLPIDQRRREAEAIQGTFRQGLGSTGEATGWAVDPSRRAPSACSLRCVL